MKWPPPLWASITVILVVVFVFVIVVLWPATASGASASTSGAQTAGAHIATTNLYVPLGALLVALVAVIGVAFYNWRRSP